MHIRMSFGRLDRGRPLSEQPSELDLAELERRMRRWHDDRERFLRECGACQATMPIDWQYCGDCGTRLATRCPSCGEPLPPLGAKYCGHCGVEIPSA